MIILIIGELNSKKADCKSKWRGDLTIHKKKRETEACEDCRLVLKTE